MFCVKKNDADLKDFEPWGYVSEKPVLSSEFSRNYMESRFPRIVENLCTDWTFFYSPESNEDTTYAQLNFNDDSWQAVQIPHTWMTYETTGDIHPYIMYASENDDAYWWKGWGYYRKKIEIDSSLKNKRFFLEFDGVQKYSAVYINGKKAGEHKGGFNSFSIEITAFIDWNIKEQNISVSVNGYRRDKWSIPPMTAGNWNVYSGIYRPVRLSVKNDIYIPYQGNFEHEGGTFVTTPLAHKDSTVVQIVTYVKNDREIPHEIKLLTQITDSRDSVWTELSETKILNSGLITAFTQQTPVLKNMSLWSDKTPVLYKVKSFVYNSDSIMDYYESPLGVRTFFWDYESNNLYVNGEKTNIRGTNRHQEYPWLGDAIPEWLMLKDMADIRYGLGINFMRTAHYPQVPLIYDFNNQHGIITVEEVPNIKNINFDDEVQERNARMMVRRDRNNPCIFFWSVGNETSDAANSEWIREEDMTRIIHARKAEGGGKYVEHTHLNLDMENLLRVTHRGWFSNEDITHGIDPTPENGQIAGSNEWQYENAKKQDGSIRGNLNHNCVAWLYQDHGADRNYVNSLLTAVNAKGWVDMYRIPKSVYFLTQANYLEEPIVHIQRYYWRNKFIGQQKSIAIDSNCEEIELFVNNESAGRKTVRKEDFNSVVFDGITIKHGELKAVGYVDGKPLAEQRIKMPEEPYQLILKSSTEKLDASNEYLAVVTAYIVDKNGTVVFDIAPQLDWNISGEATLVGPSVYKNDLGKKEAREGTGYDAIPVSNVIRGTSNKGKIEVTVSSAEIGSAKVELTNRGYEKANENLIKQPALSMKNRQKIKKDQNYKETFEFSDFMDIKLYENTEFNISDNKRLRREINNFLKRQEGAENLQGIAYEALLNQLVNTIKRMNGTLIGDDFNFMMSQYNLYLNIERVIDGCMFHVDYADLLKEMYLKMIMEEYNQVDYETACADILSYPKKHKVCYVKYGTYNSNKDELTDYDYVTRTYTIYTNEVHCYDSISETFNLPTGNKKVWEEIERINPHITVNLLNKKIIFENSNKLIIIPDYN